MTKNSSLFLRDIALIFMGGALGALVRILMDMPALGPWMPANFLACFLMGVSSAWLQLSPPSQNFGRIWRALVHTGFLGGLSTFSVLSLAAWVTNVTEATGEHGFASVFNAAWELFVLLGGFFLACLIGWGTVALWVRMRARK